MIVFLYASNQGVESALSRARHTVGLNSSIDILTTYNTNFWIKCIYIFSNCIFFKREGSVSSNNGSDMETLSPDKGGNHEVCPPKSHEKEISEEGDPTPMSTQVLTQMVKDVVNDGVKETIQKTQN